LKNSLLVSFQESWVNEEFFQKTIFDQPGYIACEDSSHRRGFAITRTITTGRKGRSDSVKINQRKDQNKKTDTFLNQWK
jgi:hypothetical protein